MHAVNTGNTCWTFVSDSTEARHVYDVIHAVSVLRGKGVSKNAIRFFTDDPKATQYTSVFDCPDPLPIQDFEKELTSLKGYEYLFITLGGHGGIDGIGHPVKITTHSLVLAARSTPDIKLAVIAVTQCFAGTFNYIDARTAPPVVMFGAANLTTSLSTPIRLNQAISGQGFYLQQWSANSFMFYLFRWIFDPKDIDGDGHSTLLDAYKFSGSSASGEIIKVKPEIYMEAQRLADDSRQLALDVKSGKVKNKLTAQLKADALRTELNQKVALMHSSQEPWLLHADLARKLVIF